MRQTPVVISAAASGWAVRPPGRTRQAGIGCDWSGRVGPGARPTADGGRFYVPRTGFTVERHVDMTATLLMNEQARRPVRCVVPISPFGERRQDRCQFASLRRDLILVAYGPVLVDDCGQNAVVRKSSEPVAQHVAGDSELVHEILEPASPLEQGISDDEQCPPIAEDFQCPGNRAVQANIIPGQHAPRLTLHGGCKRLRNRIRNGYAAVRCFKGLTLGDVHDRFPNRGHR